MNRRRFLQLALASGMYGSLSGFAESKTSMLDPWSPGDLDIHHIDTGRGNATFLIGPDGSTFLIDCGATNDSLETSAPCRPNPSHQPGEWVARYALHHAQAAGRNTLDYLIVTHIHPDHVGDVPPGMLIPDKGFVATGVSQCEQLMPADVVIDRSYPEYGDLRPPDAPFARNYLEWLDARRHDGRRIERLKVGSDHQIRLRSSGSSPAFSIRGIAANGDVWTGRDEQKKSHFPDISDLSSGDLPTENDCSIALRVAFGAFSYFTGGDLSADSHDGRLPWMNVEAPVARACGRVEVAVADHHGYFDACGPEFVKALDAQVYVIPSWHITHPGSAQLERMIGAWPGGKPRDVFATEMLPANRFFNSRWIDKMQSTQGHIIVRVAPDGKSYRVFVTDSTIENGPILLQRGPYRCRT
jgi:beta-lactamase superfamily II metal-dependent hydrolase